MSNGLAMREFHMRAVGIESAINLGENASFASVALDGADSISLTLRGLHTTRAEMFASLLLEQDPDVTQALLAAGEVLSDVTIVAQPKTGLTWGTVYTPEDVVFSVGQEK